jgi:hypothetical protein
LNRWAAYNLTFPNAGLDATEPEQKDTDKGERNDPLPGERKVDGQEEKGDEGGERQAREEQQEEDGRGQFRYDPDTRRLFVQKDFDKAALLSFLRHVGPRVEAPPPSSAASPVLSSSSS